MIPWKLFLVIYTPIPRRVGFRGEMIEAINSVHKDIAEARNSGDPVAFLAAQATATAARDAGKTSGRYTRPSAADDSDVQDLFDSIETGGLSGVAEPENNGPSEPAEPQLEDFLGRLTIAATNGHAVAPASP